MRGGGINSRAVIRNRVVVEEWGDGVSRRVGMVEEEEVLDQTTVEILELIQGQATVSPQVVGISNRRQARLNPISIRLWKPPGEIKVLLITTLNVEWDRVDRILKV